MQETLLSLEMPSPLASVSIAAPSPTAHQPSPMHGDDFDFKGRIAELQVENERLKAVISAMRQDAEDLQMQLDSQRPSTEAVESELLQLSKEIDRQLEYIEVSSE